MGNSGGAKAAKALRYVPNVAARSLSSRRSQTIGIVLPEVHGEFFSEVIRGIDLAARSEGYHILVSGSLAKSAQYQVIHINSEYANQTSDHDPQEVRLTPQGAGPIFRRKA